MSTPSALRIRLENLPPLEQLSQEEMARLFGAGPRQRLLELEGLENRELMAASLTGGILQIEGTSKADEIRIVETAGQISVQGITIESGGSQVQSVAVAQVHRIAVDGLGDNDSVWINNGSALLTPPLEVVGTEGNDTLYSGGSTYNLGPSAGVQKVIQSGPDTYTLQGGDVYRNGTKLNGGGFTLAQGDLSIGEKGVNITGLVHAGPLGMIQVKSVVDTSGNFALESDPLNGVELFGGSVKLNGAKVTITSAGAKMNASADVMGIGYADVEGKLSPGADYSLVGKGGVKIGSDKIEGIDFTIGSSEVNFKAPIPAIGDVTFRGWVSNGKFFLEGRYPQPVTVGPIVLKNITVGIGNDRFTVGADASPAGADMVINGRVDARIKFNGLYTMDIKVDAVKFGSFALGTGTAVLSNDPDVTGLKGRTIQMTLDVKAGTSIPVGPNVKFTGVVRGDGYYKMQGEDTFKLAGLELTRTTFTLEKGKGFTYEGTWNYGVIKANLNGEITAGGRVTILGTGEVGVGALKLGSVEFSGFAEKGVFTITARDRTGSIEGFNLTDSTFTITNNNTRRIIVQTLEGKLDILGLKKVTVKGDVQTNGHYKLTAVDKITLPIVGLTLEKMELSVEKGQGINYKADWNYGLFDAAFTGKITSDGSITLRGDAALRKIGDLNLGSVYLTGNGSIHTGRFTLNASGETFTIAGFKLTGGTVTVAGTNYGRNVSVTLGGTVNIPHVGSASVSGSVYNDGRYKLSSTKSVNLPIAGLTLGSFKVTLENGKGLDFTATLNFYIYNAAIKGGITSAGRLTIDLSTDSSGKLGNMTLGSITVKGVLDAGRGEYSLTFNTRKNLGIAEVDFSATAYRRGNAWVQPALTGKASVTGALKKILSGQVEFTMSASSVTFNGSMRLPLNLGTVSIKGQVYSNGTFSIGNKTVRASGFDITDALGLLKQANVGALTAMKTVMNAYSTNLLGGVRGLVNAGYIANGSYEVARFLLNTARESLGTTAKTVSDWLGGNKMGAFNAIVWGANRGLVGGVQGLIGAKLLDNDSFAVARFLLNESGRGLGETARAVSDWLGGNVGAAFWAIASGAGRGYADGIRALNWGGMMAWNFDSIFNFLKGQVGASRAATTLQQLGWTIPNKVAVSIPGFSVNVSTSGGSVKVGGYSVKW